MPVLEFVTANETVNALPAAAFPIVGLLADSVGLGADGGDAGPLTVIVRVAEAVAPPSSVTVSFAV